MLRARMHTRLLILAGSTMLFALLVTLVPIFATHAASGFTPQTRLGFPAGDDWETALTSYPELSSLGVS